MTHFRPISLCNVIYKIISKVLANRLKIVLPEIISEYQGAFVPGKLITDNVLVAYEVFHSIKNRRKGENGLCAVKLDMNKAYDRVEWDFLENMMTKLGFHQRWISMIMACVKIVNYRVYFNGTSTTNTFIPKRGLRQGDPLSPYLFLICAEGLSTLLSYAEARGDLQGVKKKDGSSFTWQSILAGRNTLKYGAIWRIGNGSLVNIWNDAWIPSSYNGKVLTPRGEMEDTIAWRYEKNGIYSVRSAYHVEWNAQLLEKRQADMIQESTSVQQKVWGKIWKLKIPGRWLHLVCGLFRLQL
uniref:Reverse transcriptase domain-containing protein n=1 Tax=Arundo donax TaxID=35708 RepID=A0A0A9DL65_ARUDO